MKCNKCGKELLATDKFCTGCGSVVSEIISQESESMDGKGNSKNEVERVSYFDGRLLQLIGWKLLGWLITGITLGLCYPFAVCMVKSWEVRHTVIDGRRQMFDGNGGQLMGKYILWFILTIITFGIYGLWLGINIKKWVARHTFDCTSVELDRYNQLKKSLKTASSSNDVERIKELTAELNKFQQQHGIYGESYFDGRLLQLIGWMLLGMIVTIFTFGICYPFALCMLKSWEVRHSVVNGKREAFDGNGGQLMGKYILWLILTVITFGIYGLWLTINIKKWVTKHISYQ